MRNEYGHDVNKRENIKISIRKNNSCNDEKLADILNEEALKNGFEFSKIDGRDTLKKM